MRLGLYGGSFDPPHRGHLLVAESARAAFALDRVLLAPVGRQPLKTAGAHATYGQRLAMTRLLCGMDGSGAMEASELDAPRADGEPNYTVDTLQILHATLAPEALSVIAGADAFLDLRRWREPDRLLMLAEWIVVSRPGLREAELDRLQLRPEQRARVHWLSGVHDPVSATEVRARLAAGAPCDRLIPAPVLAYIRAHDLYRAGEAVG